MHTNHTRRTLMAVFSRVNHIVGFYVKELGKRNKTHYLAAFSGQMAYFFVLSFFPLLIFILSIISKLNLNYDFIVDAFMNFLPGNVSVLITEFISQKLATGSSAVLSISGLTMLYSSSRAVGALQRAINASYEVIENRHFIVVKMMGMFYTLMFTLIIVLSAFVPSLVKNVLSSIAVLLEISIDPNVLSLFHYFRNILLFSIFVVVIVSIYAFLPNKKMHLYDIFPGALFSIFGFTATNFIFSKVVVKLTDYSILYGSLSAVIAFMIWVYFLSTIIILGAEINAIHLQNHDRQEARFDSR